MNLIQRVAARAVKSVTSIFALDSSEARQYLTGAHTTYTGRVVTPESALGSIAVLACVRLISYSQGSIPLHVYDGSGAAPERVKDHWLQDLLDQPNSEMSGTDFRTAMSAGMETRGNAYAKKVIRSDGTVAALWPFNPGAIEVRRKPNGDLYYADTSKSAKEYDPKEIFHLRGFSLDGVNGLSFIAQCRQGVGLALATEEYGARFFGQGAKPSVVLESVAKSTPEQRKQILDSWREHYGGMDNAHSVALAEGGLKVHVVSIPPEDAQFIESRGLNDEQMARLFGVPPHMIGLVSKSTSWGTGIEQMSIAYVVYTLTPRLKFWEESVSRSLLTEKDRKRGIYARHEVKGLLRGDIKSRYEAYGMALRDGWINRNEVRGWEELPPIPGGGGQIFTINSAVIPLEMAGKVNQSAPNPNQ
jgi:HK97 family phage portal protein